jgi:hypothetical protein
MQDGLQAIVARIDERTEHMGEDIRDLKVSVGKVSELVTKHCEDLAVIKSDIENLNHAGWNKKQVAGIGGVGGLITGAIIAIIDFFVKH